jgi:hypothetical protein
MVESEDIYEHAVERCLRLGLLTPVSPDINKFCRTFANTLFANSPEGRSNVKRFL